MLMSPTPAAHQPCHALLLSPSRTMTATHCRRLQPHATACGAMPWPYAGAAGTRTLSVCRFQRSGGGAARTSLATPAAISWICVKRSDPSQPAGTCDLRSTLPNLRTVFANTDENLRGYPAHTKATLLCDHCNSMASAASSASCSTPSCPLPLHSWPHPHNAGMRKHRITSLP